LQMPLVAAAIAAFDKVNDSRCRSSLPKFGKIIFPAIDIQYGTHPAFYKICISQQFRDSVASVLTDQSTRTTVYCHYPQVDFRYLYDGMMRLATRHELLRHMEAFRQLIMSGEMVSVNNHLSCLYFFQRVLLSFSLQGGMSGQ
jgi:hypothetical protein